MDLMIQDVKFSITPQSREEGDCIQLQISGAQNVQLSLTPQQARALASDLIQTVYRAEVKSSLQNTERRSGAGKADVSSDKFSMRSPHVA